MTTGPEAASAMTTPPIIATTPPSPAVAAELTPTVAWSRRVRRIGGLIQAAFAAFWLARASLAIGGRAEDVLIAVSGVAVIGVFSYAIRVTAGTAPRPAGPQARRIERLVTLATIIELAAAFVLPVIVIADTITMYPREMYENGMAVVTSTVIRNHPNALSPRVKSLNYLNNILAKIEANNGGCEEAVMLNAEGFVAECTGDNLFIVKNGALVQQASKYPQGAVPAKLQAQLIAAAGGGSTGISLLTTLNAHQKEITSVIASAGALQALQPYVQSDSPIVGATKVENLGFDWSLNRPPR